MQTFICIIGVSAVFLLSIPIMAVSWIAGGLWVAAKEAFSNGTKMMIDYSNGDK